MPATTFGVRVTVTIDPGTSKKRGDVAEYRVLVELLERDFFVLKPVGDRLPYDLAVDVGGKLVRVQVKRAWHEPHNKCFSVDIRRSLTNRRVFRHATYNETDFDFLIVWPADLKTVFYIFPVGVALEYASGITMVEDPASQKPRKSCAYRDRWDLIDSSGLDQTSGVDSLSRDSAVR